MASILESARKAKGLSQAELARELGLRGKSSISMLETKRRNAPVKLARRIEQFFDGAVPAASLCPDLEGLTAERRP